MQLETLQLLGDIPDPPAIDQFVGPQRKPAVGALRSLLDQPAMNAGKAAEFRTVRTQSRIPQLVHTNETTENVGNTLKFKNNYCQVNSSTGVNPLLLITSILKLWVS